MIHELKTWPKPFDAVLDGTKTFDVRVNDRGYQVGDELLLQEYAPQISKFTGRTCRVRVTYLLAYGPDPGGSYLQHDVVVLGITKAPAPAPPGPPKLAEGWGGPLLASKFHYFVNSHSLCRRWAFTGELQAGEVGETCRTEDCVACYRKLQKRRATKEKP